MNPHQENQTQNQDDFDQLTNNNNNNNDDNDGSLYCPSFSTYTGNTQIAESVSRAIVGDYNYNNNDFDSEFEFEFELAENAEPGCTPVYPVFNRDLLRDLGSVQPPVQLGKLFLDADIDDDYHDPELEGVSPETYCLWAPKPPPPIPTPLSPSRCMKSSSTGSGPAVAVSKTWRLRNLLRRSKSDGKEGLMLVNESPPTTKLNKKKSSDIDNVINYRENTSSSLSSKTKKWASPGRGGGAGMRRKSYLPYKQDLLGFFGSPQTLRKINIPPF